MRFDENNRVYWDSLTPQQKFDWEHLDIDPTLPKEKAGSICSKHFEQECLECHKGIKVYDKEALDFFKNFIHNK